MTEPIIPVIRLPVRPEDVVRLDTGGIALGGVRIRTTIYVVQEPDMPGGNQTVTTLVAPLHATVLFSVRDDE